MEDLVTRFVPIVTEALVPFRKETTNRLLHFVRILATVLAFTLLKRRSSLRDFEVKGEG